MNYKEYIFKSVLDKLYNYRLHKIQQHVNDQLHLPLRSFKDQMLTEAEKNEIFAIWGRFKVDFSLLHFQMYKKLGTFNPYFVPCDIYYPLILNVINSLDYRLAFSHKGLYPVFYEGLKRPSTAVYSIEGKCFGPDNKIIPTDALESFVFREDLVVKPTLGYCGHGFRVIDNEKDRLPLLIKEYKGNFIVQEKLKQSPKTAIFNDSSLNTFRICSLLLNGKVSVSNITLKFGGKGSLVDNFAGGGSSVGFTPDGQIYDYGYDGNMEKIYTYGDGKPLKGVRIDEVKDIVDFVKENHQHYLPLVGFVGWDVALDADNKPVMIEVNTTIPGVTVDQVVTNVPSFGDRTEEVIDFVLKRKPRLHIPYNKWFW